LGTYKSNHLLLESAPNSQITNNGMCLTVTTILVVTEPWTRVRALI